MAAVTPLPGLVCPRCGQAHRVVRLRALQDAACAQCGNSLRQASRLGPHALPALAVTGLVLALPANLLPLVTLTKFGDRQTTFLMSGVEELNRRGLPHLALLVFFCAVVGPVVLAGLLLTWWVVAHGKTPAILAPRLHRTLARVQTWSMAEVFLLGGLIAFVKLDRGLQVSACAGLWFYAGMAVAILWAWRTFVRHYGSETGGPAAREAP